MIKLTIEDKTYNIPSNFDELTLGHYCDIFYNLDDIADIEDEDEKRKALIKKQSVIISRLLNENDDFSMELPISVYTRILEETNYIYDIERFNKQMNNEIEINDKKYTVKSILKLTTRQYIDIDEILKDKGNKNRFCDVLSIMIQDDYQGNYKALSNEIAKIPSSKGLPLMLFFYHLNKQSQIHFQISSQLEVIQNHLQQKIEDFKKTTNG